ncbi:MAG: RHS repeat-associated core domain-containing protein [Bacteroidota bacterium]
MSSIKKTLLLVCFLVFGLNSLSLGQLADNITSSVTDFPIQKNATVTYEYVGPAPDDSDCLHGAFTEWKFADAAYRGNINYLGTGRIQVTWNGSPGRSTKLEYWAVCEDEESERWLLGFIWISFDGEIIATPVGNPVNQIATIEYEYIGTIPEDQSGEFYQRWEISNPFAVASQTRISNRKLQVTWNGTPGQSVDVLFVDAHEDFDDLNQTLGVKEVDFSPCMEPTSDLFINPVITACEEDIVRYRIDATNLTSVSWVDGPGYIINGTFGSKGEEADILFTTAAELSISADVSNGCESARISTPEVEVVWKPELATCIDCPQQACLGIPRSFRVLDNAQEFVWELPAGATLISLDAPHNSKVQITFAQEGTQSVNVVPFNENGLCEGDPLQLTVEVLPNVEPVREVAYNHSKLADNNADPLPESLYLNSCRQVNGDCPTILNALHLKGKLDLGEQYNWGADANFNIEASFAVVGIPFDGPELGLATITLSIDKHQPEQLYYQVFDQSFIRDLREIQIRPQTGSYVFGGLVNETDIRFIFSYEEEKEIDASMAVLTLDNPVFDGWEGTFSWEIANDEMCVEVPMYEFQLTRNYGQTPDWTQALKMYTDEENITVAMGEGSGYYSWRVRPIGSYEGGISNPKNWDFRNWFDGPIMNEPYEHPDGDKNWIYSRAMTEGNRLKEQLVFANGLQQIKQQQTKVKNRVTATQTLQDYSGRDALTSLPVPMSQPENQLGYKTEIISNQRNSVSPYTVQDFDLFYSETSPAFSYNGYYSGEAQTDGDQSTEILNEGVPSDGGYPFSRILYTNDGTGRVKEQSGVGYEHRVGGEHSVKTFYSGVSESEMLMLFGEEAPESANVHKIITFDANNTASVSYQNKDEKILATALSIGTGNSALEPLTENRNAKQVYEVIEGGTKVSEFLQTTRKPLFFTSQQDVFINYSITPSQIEAFCNTVCATCDYRIEIYRHEVEDGGGDVILNSDLVGELDIPMTEACGSTQPWSIAEASFTARAATHYILERRVVSNNRIPNETITYLNDYISSGQDDLETLMDSELATILGFVETDDLPGLYAHLEQNYTYDSDKDAYRVPLSCDKEIYVPTPDICENEVVDNVGSCRLIDEKTGIGYTFEEYFEFVWQGEPFAVADNTGRLPYLFFTDRYEKEKGRNYKISYVEGQFDAMMTEFINNNGTLISCSEIWDIWKREVSTFKNWYEISGSDDFTGGVDGQPSVTYEHSILNNLIAQIESVLASRRDVSNEDLCQLDDQMRPTYLAKTDLYGFIEGNKVDPDIDKAFYLVYYNEESTDLQGYFKFLAGIDEMGPAPTMNDFETRLGACEKYRLSIGGGNFNNDLQGDAETLRTVAIEECHEGCESRGEAFKQAIINSIFKQSPSTIIEYYRVSSIVSYDPNTQTDITTFTGVRDESANTSGFDYSECELDGMVNALIENCKGYCNLDFVTNTETGALELGTTGQIDDLNKVFLNGFEVEVLPDGATCDTGDFIPSQGGYWPLVDDLITDLSHSFNVKEDGEGGYWIGSPFSKELVINTGETISPKVYDGISNNYIFIHFSEIGEALEYYHLDLEPSNEEVPNSTISLPVTSGTSEIPLSFILEPRLFPNSTNTIVLNINGVPVYSEEYFRPFPENGVSAIVGAIDVFDGDLLWADHQRIFNMRSGRYSSDKNRRVYPYEDANGNVYTIKTKQQTVYPDNIWPNHFSIEKRNIDGQEEWVSDAIKFSEHTGVRQMDVDKDGNTYLWFILNHSNFEVLVNGVVEQSFTSNFPEGMAVVKIGADGKYDWCKTIFMERTGFSPNSDDIIPLDNSVLIQFGGGDLLEIDGVSHTLNSLALVEFDKTDGNLIWVNSEELLGATDYVFRAGDSFTGHYQLGDKLYFIFLNRTFGIDDVLSYATWDINSKALKQYSYQGVHFPNTATYFTDIIATNDQLVLFARYASNPDLLFDGRTIDAGGVNYNPKTYLMIANYLGNGACPTPNLCFRWTDPYEAIEGDVVYDPQLRTCESIAEEIILNEIDAQKEDILKARGEEIYDKYVQQCTMPENLTEDFSISYELGLHHFTLYYYDRAGNLMRTVPPAGVNLVNVADASAIASARTTDPQHDLVTSYQFNSMGQLIGQQTPDAGNTSFQYNLIGQLRYSQNEEQANEENKNYSYTKYDNLGRIIEVGQATLEEGQVFDDLQYLVNDMNYPSAGTELTVTKYSEPATISLPLGYAQRNLINRVSYSYVDMDGAQSGDHDDRSMTVYSYDAHGNVEWLVQKLPGLDDVFLIEYEYDLISGNVNQVSFNPHRQDKFFHKYEYDVENRIEKVYTSMDGYLWDQDARYEYFLHGPLKRVQIGEDLIQGVDFTYTLQGWLKAINQQDLIPANDPGLDGIQGVTTPDVFAMTLGYFNLDYSGTRNLGTALEAKDGRNLYNGNISTWTTNAKPLPGQLYAYTGVNGRQFVYDELNRITESRFNVIEQDAFVDHDDFASSYTYDGNGNLKTLSRNTNQVIDDLTYEYYPENNQLKRVRDSRPNDLFEGDVDDQSDDRVVDGANYEYDGIGNMIKDHYDTVTIDWTLYGKVKTIDKADKLTEYFYDATGNRVIKSHTDKDGVISKDYYIRDASGNTLAVYSNVQEPGDPVNTDMALKEVSLFGSERLGLYKPEILISDGEVKIPSSPAPDETLVNSALVVDSYEGSSYLVADGVTLTLTTGFSASSDGADDFSVRSQQFELFDDDSNIYTRYIDKKNYEMQDHLGNVRAVVSDLKLSDVSNGTPQNFEAKLLEQTDYYPFGMAMPNRLVPIEDMSLATLETENAQEEQAAFGSSYNNGAIVQVDIYNATETQTYTADKSQRLTGLDGEIVGLAKSLDVKRGDVINMEVFAKYLPLDPNADATNLSMLMAPALSQSLASAGVDVTAELQQTFEELFSSGPIVTEGDESTPRGYLNYLLFDESLTLVDAGYQRVSALAEEDGSNIEHEKLTIEVRPEQAGTMYIYLSNESLNVTEVFFDDFRIDHTTNRVLQQPIAYRYGYNGKERDGSFGLTNYDYGFRIYNPALGKFLSVDPLTRDYAFYTPYQFAGNKPISSIDLDGLEEYIIHSKYLTEVFTSKLKSLRDEGASDAVIKQEALAMIKRWKNREFESIQDQQEAAELYGFEGEIIRTFRDDGPLKVTGYFEPNEQFTVYSTWNESNTTFTVAAIPPKYHLKADYSGDVEAPFSMAGGFATFSLVGLDGAAEEFEVQLVGGRSSGYLTTETAFVFSPTKFLRGPAIALGIDVGLIFKFDDNSLTEIVEKLEQEGFNKTTTTNSEGELTAKLSGRFIMIEANFTAKELKIGITNSAKPDGEGGQVKRVHHSTVTKTH